MDRPPVRFGSMTSYYDEFANELRRSNGRRRESVRRFLDAVAASAPARAVGISVEKPWLRAQQGSCRVELADGTWVDQAYPCERMKPISEKVGGGRANFRKTCVLYLANSVKTAITECRPWIGLDMSVAAFKFKRTITAVNLSEGHGQIGALHVTVDQIDGLAPIEQAHMTHAAWIDMGNAFSRPVQQRDEPRDYLPTQLIAARLREEGYDGIVYRSNFGTLGYNLVLFDLAIAECLWVKRYRVTELNAEAEEDGHPYVCVAQS